MATDLITRIILDDNKFNDTLSKVRKELNISGSVADGFTSSLKGVAGSLGLIMGAGEAFNKLMEGSQVFGDNLTLSLNSVSDSLDELFYSLGTGDFSAFNNGLDNIIAKSKAATAALDQLGNTRISYGYFDSYYNDQMSGAMLNAKNKQLGKADREKGFADWDAVLKQKEEAAKSLSDTAIDAALKTAKKGTLLRDVGLSDIERIVKLDILPSGDRDSMKGQLAEEYNTYEKLLEKIEATRRARLAGTNDRSQIEMINSSAALKKQNLADQYKEAILFNKLLQKDSDEELQNLVNIAAEARNTTKAIMDQRREYNESIVEFRNSLKTGGGSGTGKINPLIPEGSIADLEKQIANAKAELRLAVDPESRVKLNAEIKALENQKHVIEFQFRHPNGPGKVERKKGGLAGLADKSGLADTSGLSEQLDQLFSKKKIKNISSYADSIQMVADSVTGLSNNFNSGAAAGLQYFANVVSGAAQAAVAIAALIPVKEAESQANAKAAVTGAAASQAFIPIVGPFLAMAAVASLIGVMLNIPKFAKGGIVGGSSFSGDKILTRLNSGEMVLNSRQQGNLFNLLSNGSSVNDGGRVKFEIEGKKLVGVINNYNNQRKKIL